jgi:hypothetical protein
LGSGDLKIVRIAGIAQDRGKLKSKPLSRIRGQAETGELANEFAGNDNLPKSPHARMGYSAFAKNLRPKDFQISNLQTSHLFKTLILFQLQILACDAIAAYCDHRF